MAAIIQIKRSGDLLEPSILKVGELAYSYRDSSRKLFIGIGPADSNDDASDISIIGGEYYTDLLTIATPGVSEPDKFLLLGNLRDVDYLRIRDLYADDAEIERLVAGDVEVFAMNADKINVSYLNADSADVNLLRVLKSYTDEAYIDSANVDHAFIDSADIVLSRTQTAYIDSANIDHAFIDSADIVLSRTQTAYIDSANIEHAFVDSADIVLSRTQTAYIDSANIEHAFIDSADVILSRTKTAYIDSANIEHAFVDSADIVLSRTQTAYIDSANIKHTYIDHADVEYAFIDSTDINEARINNLRSLTVSIDYADIDSADIKVLRALNANLDSSTLIYTTIKEAEIDQGHAKVFGIDSASIEYANIIYGNIINLNADSFYAIDATIDSAYIKTLSVNELTVNDIFTGMIKGPEVIVIDPTNIGDNTGKLIIKGDLQIDGVTTTVNSTTVTINDKNIVLADSAADASQADGAGITIAGADATITYRFTDDRFVVNKDLDIPSLYAHYADIKTADIDIGRITNAEIDSAQIRHAVVQEADIVLSRTQTGYIDSANIEHAFIDSSDIVLSRTQTGYIDSANIEHAFIDSADINVARIHKISTDSAGIQYADIDSADVDVLRVKKLYIEYASIDSADIRVLRVDDLSADSANIEHAYIDSADIVLSRTDTAYIDSADIKRANIQHAYIDSADIVLSRTDTAYIDSANIEHAYIDSADIVLSRTQTAYIDSANIEHAFIDSADIVLSRTDTAYIDSANVEHAFIDSADIVLSRTQTAYIDSANIKHAFIDSADIVLSRTDTAYIDSANIEHAFIDSADIVLSRTDTAYIDSANIKHAFIDSADIRIARIDSADIRIAGIQYAKIDSADADLLRVTGLTVDSAYIKYAKIDSAELGSIKVDQIYTSIITGPEQIVIDPLFGNDSGNVIIRGNLIVQGYTTTVNSTEVTINDKNLVLADSAADSNEAHGAGITINGANAKITYSATSDNFEFNKGIKTKSADINYLTADSAYIRVISGDSAYLKNILAENIHITGKLSGNIGIDGIIHNSVIIANDSGSLTSDSSILFDSNRFVLYIDKATIDNQGNMTIAGDLNVGGTVIGQQGIQISGDLEADKILLKDSAIRPGFVFIAGQNDSITGSNDLLFGSFTSNDYGSFNGLNIGLERIYDSGYYRFSVNQSTGAVAAQSIKIGDYTNRPVGQFTQTYPTTGDLSFYGLEVNDKVLISSAQLNTFQTDLSRDAALLLDSFSEDANIIQVKSLLDSTLFEVKKDGSINFFGSLLKDGIPFEAAGVFKKTTYEDVYYDAPAVTVNFTDPQSILLKNAGRGGRVGLNTKTPKHQLEINDGELFISGPLNTGSTYPETINLGYSYPNATSKFLFFPQRAATRGGYWDNNGFSAFNFGNYSAAFGRNVNAQGISSIALGDSASAIDDYTIAIGKNITTGTNNDRTIVIGIDNTVVTNSGNYIMLLGTGNTNAGDETYLFGRNNTINSLGDRSYVFGRENVVNGLQTTVIGATNTVDGANARVFGRDNVVTSFAPGATVIGNDNYTDATQTIILGSNARTYGQNAMAFGNDIEVKGDFSVGISLSGAQQKPTIDSDNILGILGGRVLINPTVDSYQVGSNALVVVGDILYTGQIRQAVTGGGTVSANIFVDDGTDVTYTEGKNVGIHVDSPYHRVQTAGSFAVRDETLGIPYDPNDPNLPFVLDQFADDQKQFLFDPAAGLLRAGQIRFQPNDSAGYLSVGLGYRPIAAHYSTAIGYEAVAGGTYSTSIGNNITSRGQRSFVIGDNITSYSDENVIIGKNNQEGGIGGQSTYVFGRDNQFSSSNSFIIGQGNSVNAGTSYAIGLNHTISGDFSTAIGQRVNITDQSTRVIVINPEAIAYNIDSVSDQVIIPGINTKVAIGKTSADYKLDVAGDVNIDGGIYLNKQLAGIFAYDSDAKSYIVPRGLVVGGELTVDVDSTDGKINLYIDSTGITVYDSLGVKGNLGVDGETTFRNNVTLAQGYSLTLDSGSNILLKAGNLSVFGDLSVDSGNTYIQDLFIKGLSFDSYLAAAISGNLGDILNPVAESAQGAIDTINNSSPVIVVTNAAHGLGTNWTIEFDSIQGMPSLNTGTYFVDVINTLSFELWDDSTGNVNRNPIDGAPLGTHIQGTGSFIGYPYAGSTPQITVPNSIFEGLLGLIDTDYVQARVTLENFWAYNPAVGPALSFNFDPDPANRVPVGIHTRTPGINYALDVNGNVNVGGDLYIQNQLFENWFVANAGAAVSQVVDATYINQLVTVNESTIVNYIDSNYVTNIITDEYILLRSRDSSFWQRNADTLFFGTYPNVYNVRVGIGTDDPVSKFQVAGKGTFDSGVDVLGNLFVKDFNITTDEAFQYTFIDSYLSTNRFTAFDSNDISGAYFAQIVNDSDTSFLLNLGFSDPIEKYLDVYTINSLGDSSVLIKGESAGTLGITADYIITGPTNNFIQVSTSAVDSDNLWIYFTERSLPLNRLVLQDSDNNSNILDYNTGYVQVIISNSLGQQKTILSGTDYITVNNGTLSIKDGSYLDLGDIITINDRSPKILSENELWGKLDQYGNVNVYDGNVIVHNGTLQVSDSATFQSEVSAPDVKISNSLTNNGTTYFNGDVYYESSSVFYYGPTQYTGESDGFGNLITYRLSFDSNIERIVDSNYIGNRLQNIWSYNTDQLGNQQIYYDGGGAIVIGQPSDMLLGDSDTKFLSSRGNAVFLHDSVDADPGVLTIGVVPEYGAGSRMMWIPQRAAFRAGYVSDFAGTTVWDDNRVGLHSVAIGFDAEAGHYSTAMGYAVSAGSMPDDGVLSVSFGINITNKGNNSIGLGKDLLFGTSENGISIGKNITNLDDNNFAIGDTITVTQKNAENVAIGKNVTVTGSSNGVGIGRNIIADRGSISIGDTNTGTYGGVAVGRDNTANYGVSVGIGTTSNRPSSVAIGTNATASNSSAAAIGGNSQASGSSSTAIGVNTRAGNSSIAVGTNSTANGSSSVSVGSSNQAGGSGSVALGRGNRSLSSSGITIGLSNTASSGAISVGSSNQATTSGIIFGRSNYAYASVVFGAGNDVSSGSSVAIGYSNKGSQGAILFGKNNGSSGSNYAGAAVGLSNNSNYIAYVFGRSNNSNNRSSVYGDYNVGNNTTSYIFGYYNNTNSRSFVSGRNNVSNDRSNVFGNYNTSNNKVNIFGNYNINTVGSASGDYGYIFGNSSLVTNYGFAYGSRNSITNGGYIFGSQSTINVGGYSFGETNTVSFGGFAFGKDNSVDGTSGTPYAFGLNNTVEDNGIAFGKNNTVNENSIGLGTGVTASGLNSLALGTNVTVSGNNSIAIGLRSTDIGDSVARNNTLAILGGQVGIGLNDPDFSYQMEVDGSFNVRTGDIYRQGKRLFNYITEDVANRTWIRQNADSDYIHSAANFEYLRSTQIPQYFFHNDLSNLYYIGGGNVGIKTNNPQYDLHVNGDINFDGKLYVGGVEIVPSKDSLNDVAIDVNYYQSFYYIDSATIVEDFIDSAYVQQRQAYFDYENIIDFNYINSRVDFSFLPDSFYIEDQINLFGNEVAFRVDPLGFSKYKNTGPAAAFLGTRIGIGYDSQDFLAKGPGLDIMDGGLYLENGNLEITNGNIYIDGELFEPNSPFVDDGTFVVYNPINGPLLNVGIGKFTPRFALDVAGDINVDEGFNFKINDQNLLHEILDSAYINSKLDRTLFLDSAEALALVDSNYIKSIADSDYIKTAVDSAHLYSIVNDNYIKGIADSAYILSAASENYIKSIADSDYIKTAANASYIKSIADSDYIKTAADELHIKGIADSAYILSAANENYIKGIADSDYIKTAADELHIKGIADSDYIKTAANASYVKGIANIPYIQGIINEDYIKGFVDSAYAASLTGIGTKDIDFGSHKIKYSNSYSSIPSLPNAGLYEGMFAVVKTDNRPYASFGGTWNRIAIGQNVRTTDNVLFNRVETTDDLIVNGNLQVNGVTSTVNSVSLEVTDNMIYMNAGESSGSPIQFVDIGFAANVNDRGSYEHAGFFRDATDGIWKIFQGYAPEPDAAPQINTGHASFELASLQVDQIIANTIVRNSNVGIGSYGSASLIPVISIDSYGFIDSIGEVSVAGVDSVSYNTSSGQFTIFTADGNAFSDTITLDPFTTDDLNEGVNNLYYTNDRVITLVDSAYVLTRSPQFDYLGIIDSAYVQARIVPEGVDSAAVTALIDSAYVLERSPQFDYLGIIDSAYVLERSPQFDYLGIIDSAYVQSRVVPQGVDSAAVTALIDSAYINERIGITAEVSLLANQLRYQTYYYSATPGQTVVTGVDQNGATLDYSLGTVQVFLNGINLLNGIDYTATDGHTITLAQPTSGSEDIFISTLKITGEVGFGFREYLFTADSDQTEFFGADDNGVQLQYTVGNIIAHLNGIKLLAGVDYTATDGNKIVLNDPALLEDELTITTAYVENSQVDSNLNEFGDITVNGLTNKTGRYTNLVNGIEADSAGIVIVDTVDHNSRFTSIEYILHMEDSSNGHSQISKMLVTYNKTNVFSTEYGIVNSYLNDSDMGLITVDVIGSTIRLKFEKATGTGNVTVKPVKTIIQ